MRLVTSVVIFMLMVVSAWAAEDLVLRVKITSGQVAGLQELGSLVVTDVGAVKLTARRDGNQLLVQAIGPDNKLIGQAESVVGLRETPVYVNTSKGLQKLTVFWKSP